MSDFKNKEMSDVLTGPDVKGMLANGKKDISQMPTAVMENVKNLMSAKHKNQLKTETEEKRTLVHTEADINWATIANKITVPNIAKAGLTLGGGYCGSVLGVGVCTGLGFALGGPSGAVMGYTFGNVAGFGAGVIGGHKFSKVVVNELEDTKQEKIVQTGTTQITVDKKIDVEKR
jgi:hypothetical protein